MAKFRTIVLTFAATLVLGAVASNGASAAEWHVGGAALGVNNSAALASSAAIDGSGILVDPSLGIEISCKGPLLLINARIYGGDKNLAEKLIFHGCTEITPTACSVPDLLTTEHPVESLILNMGGGHLRILFKTQEGKEFINIPFSGVNCSISGEKPVKGEVLGNAPIASAEHATQELEGLGTVENNSLELATSKAYLLGKILLRLASGAAWSFQ